MVGPSTTEAERASQQRKLYVVFVLIVGASSGLIAVQAQATLTEIAVVTIGGLIVGALLTWYLVRMTRR